MFLFGRFIMENELKYEDALKELSGIVEKLERGDIPLDQTIKYYEQGQLLLKSCREQLNSAEGKLLKLGVDGIKEIS